MTDPATVEKVSRALCSRLSTLDQKLKDQIARWSEDAKGCRALERQTGRNHEWIEAERFRVAAETMETVCNEARKLFE